MSRRALDRRRRKTCLDMKKERNLKPFHLLLPWMKRNRHGRFIRKPRAIKKLKNSVHKKPKDERVHKVPERSSPRINPVRKNEAEVDGASVALPDDVAENAAELMLVSKMSSCLHAEQKEETSNSQLLFRHVLRRSPRKNAHRNQDQAPSQLANRDKETAKTVECRVNPGSPSKVSRSASASSVLTDMASGLSKYIVQPQQVRTPSKGLKNNSTTNCNSRNITVVKKKSDAPKKVRTPAKLGKIEVTASMSAYTTLKKKNFAPNWANRDEHGKFISSKEAKAKKAAGRSTVPSKSKPILSTPCSVESTPLPHLPSSSVPLKSTIFNTEVPHRVVHSIYEGEIVELCENRLRDRKAKSQESDSSSETSSNKENAEQKTRTKYDPFAHLPPLEKIRRRSELSSIAQTVRVLRRVKRRARSSAEEKSFERHFQEAIKLKKLPEHKRIVRTDVTCGKEPRPISAVCYTGNKKNMPNFEYIAKNEMAMNSELDPIDFQISCNCTAECSTSCPCVYASIIYGSSFINGESIAMDRNTDFYNSLVISCGKSCRCQGCCSNSTRKFMNSTKVEVFRRDDRMGFGVRTLQPIDTGTVVVEFAGEVISGEEHDKRTSQKNETTSHYCWTIYCTELDDKIKTILTLIKPTIPVDMMMKDVFIDPSKRGNLGRFVSHGDFPNLVPIRLYTNDLRPETARLMFIASQPIRAGEEVFSDYGHLFRQVDREHCLCGTIGCGNSGKYIRSAYLTKDTIVENIAKVIKQYEIENNKFRKANNIKPVKMTPEEETLVTAKASMLLTRPKSVPKVRSRRGKQMKKWSEDLFTTSCETTPSVSARESPDSHESVESVPPPPKRSRSLPESPIVQAKYSRERPPLQAKTTKTDESKSQTEAPTPTINRVNSSLMRELWNSPRRVMQRLLS